MLELGNCESRISLMYSECLVEMGGQNTSLKKFELESLSKVFNLDSITSAFNNFISGLLKENPSFNVNQASAMSKDSTTVIISADTKTSKAKALKRCVHPDEFLTLEEINKILESGHEVPQPNKAAISRMVGLGWDDINTLCWEEIDVSGKTEYRIRLKKDKKVSNSSTIPVEATHQMSRKELEESNRRLRKMYMDLSLEHRMLKDSIDKNSILQYEHLFNSKY